MLPGRELLKPMLLGREFGLECDGDVSGDWSNDWFRFICRPAGCRETPSVALVNSWPGGGAENCCCMP